MTITSEQGHRPPSKMRANERPLVEDIRLLGRLLGDVIREQEGQAAFDQIEQIRKLSVAFRRDADTQADKALKKLLKALTLCLGLKDDTIDAICSDHTPVNDDAKLLPFAEAEAGASSLELLLPLTLKWATDNKASLANAIAKITSQPAHILNIAAGDLSVNANADIVIFNPKAEWKVEASQLKSQGKNTPFLGQSMQGQVQYTLLNGQLAYQSN